MQTKNLKNIPYVNTTNSDLLLNILWGDHMYVAVFPVDTSYVASYLYSLSLSLSLCRILVNCYTIQV